MDQTHSPETTVWLVRHGETEWSLSGQHTGRNDLPLTQHGEEEALAVRDLLKGRTFSLVLCSPLTRARRTCEIAGFSDVAVIDPEIQEWDYGDVSGRTSAQVREEHPGWTIWKGPVFNGESLDQLGARAKRVAERLRSHGDRCLVFSHGHFLRVLTAEWLRLPPVTGQNFALQTASVCVLGEDAGYPAIRAWNYRTKLGSDL